MIPDPIEEAVARALCSEWGYTWDGDPDEDEDVIPDTSSLDDCRPTKELFRAIVRTTLAALEVAGYELVRKQEPDDGRD